MKSRKVTAEMRIKESYNKGYNKALKIGRRVAMDSHEQGFQEGYDRARLPNFIQGFGVGLIFCSMIYMVLL